MFLTDDEKLIAKTKKRLAVEFEMKDLGLMHYFLGLEVWQSLEEIFLNQGKYVVEILKRFDMLESKSQDLANLNLQVRILSNLKLVRI